MVSDMFFQATFKYFEDELSQKDYELAFIFEVGSVGINSESLLEILLFQDYIALLVLLGAKLETNDVFEKRTDSEREDLLFTRNFARDLARGLCK